MKRLQKELLTLDEELKARRAYSASMNSRYSLSNSA